MAARVLEITIPEYKVGQAPDAATVGKKLDDLVKKHFAGKKVVIRCIGSQDHPNLSLDELAGMVTETGTDKYDPSRIGVGYEAFVRKGIQVDFYGEDVEINDATTILTQQVYEMYHSAIGDRGFGVRIDLVMIYDEAQLSMVMNLYEDHPTSDGFVFKDPFNKKAALLALTELLLERTLKIYLKEQYHHDNSNR